MSRRVLVDSPYTYAMPMRSHPRARTLAASAGVLATLLSLAAPARAQLAIERAQLADRFRGMWLAEIIANWTGWRGEGRRTQPPFLTDADWGSNFGRGPLVFVTNQDPWWADDDTDIEYVYLALADEHGADLSPREIADGWRAHINRFIWVSNERARELMERGVEPPGTGIASANEFWLFIDAQLTTEMFGAIAPGMPALALELADLPIRTTSAGHASHASQFFVLLYALAPSVDISLPPAERNLWLIDEARRYIPDSSKAADVIDFVRAEYLANPDKDDWESTRDRIYERYQRDATLNNFKYRGWTESSINLATGVLCLLFGEGDLKRTIQIGTLSGWDADNPTATMGGLLGLMHGSAWVEQAFAGENLSDRYWISRTRDNMLDYLPGDPQAEDTLTLLSERMLSLVDDTARIAGASRVSAGSLQGWVFPPELVAPLEANPRLRDDTRSGTLAVLRAAGTAQGASSVSSSPTSGGVPDPAHFASGFHADFSGTDVLNDARRRYYSSENSGQSPGDTITLSVTFDRTVEVAEVRFIEGDHFPAVGGWLNSAAVELRVDGQWLPVNATPSEPLRETQPFQTIDFALDEPIQASGVRIIGAVGGDAAFVTCSALDTLSPQPPRTNLGFDLNRDGAVDVEDLAKWHSQPVDWTNDGVIDAQDRTIQEFAIRWGEIRDMSQPRRP